MTRVNKRHAELYRLEQERTELLAVVRPALVAKLGRRLQPPVLPRSERSLVNDQHLTGQDRGDPGVIGIGAVLLIAMDVRRDQCLPNALVIRRQRDGRILQELVELRRRREDPMIRPIVQRPLAGAVASAHQPPGSPIPDGKGKVAQQTLRRRQAPGLVRSQDQVGVARRRRAPREQADKLHPGLE